jgi:hypothetical protein
MALTNLDGIELALNGICKSWTCAITRWIVENAKMHGFQWPQMQMPKANKGSNKKAPKTECGQFGKKFIKYLKIFYGQIFLLYYFSMGRL